MSWINPEFDSALSTTLDSDPVLKHDYIALRNAVLQIQKQNKLFRALVNSLPEDQKEEFLKAAGMLLLDEVEL